MTTSGSRWSRPALTCAVLFGALVVAAPGIVVAGAGTDSTSSKSPRPRVVLRETFDDDHGWGGGQSSPAGSWTATLQPDDGVLVLRVDRPPSEIAADDPELFPASLVARADDLADVRLEAAVSWVGPVAPVVSCRADIAHATAYGFALLPSGKAAILKRTDRGLTPLAETRRSVFDPETAGRTHLILRGDCVDVDREENGAPGVRLMLGLDGKRLLTVVDRDEPITGGGLATLAAFHSPTGPDGQALPFDLTFVVWDAFVVVRR